MASEGLRDSYLFSVYSDQADWSTEPAIGTKATIGGTQYRILAKQLDNPGQLLRLDLGEKYAE